MFIATVFIIAKSRNNTNIHELKNGLKTWCIYIREYYLSIKGNEALDTCCNKDKS